MIEIVQSIAAFIVVIGVLISFHEFGHYYVARRCDVKILRFSIGFGKPIYTKMFGADNSEFVIAALPLGGYVKMLDEREGAVNKEELSRSFNRKPLSQRMAIVAAGPIFNFIFAVAAYWIIFIIGINGLKPIIGKVETASISATAGLREGDEIIAINNTATGTWASVIDRLVNYTVNGEQVGLRLRDPDGIIRQAKLDLSQISIDEMAEGKLLTALGLDMIELRLPAIIGTVMANGAAASSGLRQYDEIISVNGVSVNFWNEWVDIIRDNPAKALKLEVLRGDSLVPISLVPDAVLEDNQTIGRIGVMAFKPEGRFDPYMARESYPLFKALGKAVHKTWEMSLLTLRILGKMLLGEASVKNLSGPISIAQYAGQSVDTGLIAFLSLMAIVSVSLGVLNLLPVPLLDGGHLLYYLVELVSRRPVSEQTQVLGQQIGLVLLLALMSIAFYNDIIRLVG